ncbi:MAG: hypothetical protein JO245_08260 [Pseudolabrys sp.]|nr:hypothetical protein [Pseudolabrys sp.]
MRSSILVVLVSLAAGTPAAAQVDNRACAQGRATVGSADGELNAPNAKKGETLSEHLAKSGGVICPPDNVDPAIKADTPEAGKLKIIPPPGTPQNQPNVQPK